MNAIALLKKDHKTVAALFKRFEKLGDNATKEKRKIVDQIIRELSIHASIEETLFYPAARKLVKAAEDDVLEALEEHHIVKWTLSELASMSPEAERFDAKVTVLIESVRHHVKEEEQDFFPKVAKKLSPSQLNQLGAAMEAAKKSAPTRPHPRAPDSPPGNVLNVGAAIIDRVLDMGKGVFGAGKNGKSKKNGNGARAKGTNGHRAHA